MSQQEEGIVFVLRQAVKVMYVSVSIIIAITFLVTGIHPMLRSSLSDKKVGKKPRSPKSMHDKHGQPGE